jgi:hypothetical protein
MSDYGVETSSSIGLKDPALFVGRPEELFSIKEVGYSRESGSMCNKEQLSLPKAGRWIKEKKKTYSQPEPVGQSSVRWCFTCKD